MNADFWTGYFFGILTCVAASSAVTIAVVYWYFKHQCDDPQCQNYQPDNVVRMRP